MAKPAERADNRLPLRVENLRFGHHMHDHPGHRRSSSDPSGRQLYRRPVPHRLMGTSPPWSLQRVALSREPPGYVFGSAGFAGEFAAGGAGDSAGGDEADVADPDLML